MSDINLTDWTVVSGFGYNTQQPFVEVIIRPHEVQTQMSPAKAREIAGMLLQAAEAAEGDAFMMNFAKERIGLDESKAAQILLDFRKWRERRAEAGEE